MESETNGTVGKPGINPIDMSIPEAMYKGLGYFVKELIKSGPNSDEAAALVTITPIAVDMSSAGI